MLPGMAALAEAEHREIDQPGYLENAHWVR